MSDTPDPEGFFDADEAELRWRLLQRAEEIAEMGSWDLNRDTREMVWSDNLFRIFGFEPRTLVPSVEFLFERIHPADRDHVEREVGRALTEGELRPLEYRIVRPDSSLRHVHALPTLDEREGARSGTSSVLFATSASGGSPRNSVTSSWTRSPRASTRPMARRGSST